MSNECSIAKQIKFEFIINRFDYKLPLLGVDLEFTEARRVEILDCMRQLGRKISEINIASLGGVTEFDTANKLVKYYYSALVTINNKQHLLINGERVQTEEEKAKFAVYMYNQTGTKTR